MKGAAAVEEDVEEAYLRSVRRGEQAQKEKTPPKAGSKKVIVIAGPTACGKSALGHMMAKLVGGEVVSADSMQVYKGMDIGTAKMTLEERLEVPHHLVDIRHVAEPFNVVDFYYASRRCCDEILERGNIPIVVGGSGFYIHALLYGPPNGPPSVPAVREALENEMEQLGADALHDRLKILDPKYANTITVHDRHKIIRALEIIELTGQKVSKLPWKERINPLDYDFHCWFLHRPRSPLYHRIEHRCDKMVDQGLLDEVRVLDQEGLRENNSAAQAIGYRQSLDFLDSDQTRSDFKQYLEDFKTASRRYAKRQFTWFRRERLFRWLDLDLHDVETAIDMIMCEYDRR